MNPLTAMTVKKRLFLSFIFFAVGSWLRQAKATQRLVSDGAPPGPEGAASSTGGCGARRLFVCLFVLGGSFGRSSLLIFPVCLPKFWDRFPIGRRICQPVRFPSPAPAVPTAGDAPRGFRCSLRLKRARTLEKPAAKAHKLKNNHPSGVFSSSGVPIVPAFLRANQWYLGG